MTQILTVPDIEQAIREYISFTGRMPQDLYLGHNEYEALKKIIAAYTCLREVGYVEKFMGLYVFEVMKENHLGVGDYGFGKPMIEADHKSKEGE
jgi:hypothetical protein